MVNSGVPHHPTPSTSTTSCAKCWGRSHRSIPGPRTGSTATRPRAWRSCRWGSSPAPRHLVGDARLETGDVATSFRVKRPRGRERALSYNPGHDPWIFPNDDEVERQRVAAAVADFEPKPRAVRGPVPPPACRSDSRRAAAGCPPGGGTADRRSFFCHDRRGGGVAARPQPSVLPRLARRDEGGGGSWLISNCAGWPSASAPPR